MSIFILLVLLLASSIVVSFSLFRSFRSKSTPLASHKDLLDDNGSSKESDSVHMKLNQNQRRETVETEDDNRDTDNESSDTDNESIETDHLVELTEYVLSSTNETLIAVVGNYRTQPEIKSKIEYYALHKDGKNYTQSITSSTSNAHNNSNSEIILTVRLYDQSEESALHRLQELYTSERLLSFSKEFPPSTYRMSLSKDDGLSDEEKGRAKFVDTMLRQHAKRIAIMNEYCITAHDQWIEKEEKRAIQEFLQSFVVDTGKEEGVEGQSIAQKYAFNSTFASTATLEAQTAQIKELLLWFREQFPYYYSKCDYSHCNNNEKDGNLYLGSVYPSKAERMDDARAGVCELFLCKSCEKVSRFPRYHAMNKVIESRKGRCGEYSILIMRILQELGYSARYVADWADHVWCEVHLDGRWIHVDSCEACINEPHLYHGWGKNQTYIFAFHSIRKKEIAVDHSLLTLQANKDRCVASSGVTSTSTSSGNDDSDGNADGRDGNDSDGSSNGHPTIVEDVTFSYTPSHAWPAAVERRLSEHIDDNTIIHAMTEAARLITSVEPNVHQSNSNSSNTVQV